MDVIGRIGLSGIVPVVVIEDVKDAAPAARALLAGGINVMEITLRTKAGLECIEAVAEACPDMLVGAGTVLTLAQCKACVENGARFIVSPGLNEEMAKWCVENGVAHTPGCVTPTEIMCAAALRISVLKFFPANVFGGLAAMKALAGPFADIKFIPTGGVNMDNLSEFSKAPYVHAVGGSWLCSKEDIRNGRFEKIENCAKESVAAMLGFEFKHVGLNMENDDAAKETAQAFSDAFGFRVKEGSSSIFLDTDMEVMRSRYLGGMGHIAVGTNDVQRAVAYLEARGFKFNADSAKYKNGKCVAVYLQNEMGGFAVHLLQK